MRTTWWTRPVAIGAIVVAVGAAGTFSLTRVEDVGFGPAIQGDLSLNANIGTLDQVVAWKNMPGSQAFQVAESVVNDQSFDQVKLVALNIPNEQTAQTPRQQLR